MVRRICECGASQDAEVKEEQWSERQHYDTSDAKTLQSEEGSAVPTKYEDTISPEKSEERLGSGTFGHEPIVPPEKKDRYAEEIKDALENGKRYDSAEELLADAEKSAPIGESLTALMDVYEREGLLGIQSLILREREAADVAYARGWNKGHEEGHAAGAKAERERLRRVVEGMRKTPLNELRESVADIHNAALDAILRDL